MDKRLGKAFAPLNSQSNESWWGIQTSAGLQVHWLLGGEARALPFVPSLFDLLSLSFQIRLVGVNLQTFSVFLCKRVSVDEGTGPHTRSCTPSVCTTSLGPGTTTQMPALGARGTPSPPQVAVAEPNL